MFTLIVRFDLPDAASAETFDALVAQAVPLIREREEGTLTYLPYRVTDEPLARIFYEVYRDAAAHEDHESRPHTQEFLTAVRSIVTSIRVESLTEA
jgi:quinol monooxygenase YgiN